MKHLYKMLAVLALLLNFGAAQAQYSIGLAISAENNTFGFLGVEAVFGSRLHYDQPTIGEVVVVKDIKGNSTACDSIAEDLTDKIALIDRGTCNFVPKCFNAARKGAIAILVVTNNPVTAQYPNGNPNIGSMGIPADAALIALAKEIKVPCLMLFKIDGDTLKSFATKGMMFAALQHPNNYSNDAYKIETGVKYPKYPLEAHPYAGEDPTFFPEISAIDSLNAKNSAFFVYEATKTGRIAVSSCNGEGDTNLNVYESPDVNAFLKLDGYDKKWSNEGVCKKNAADTKNQAAELRNISVDKGKYYYIEFDDKNSADSFVFKLDFIKADSVDVTFSVDMKSEAAIDAAGVYIAGNFQGWDPSKTKMDNVAGTKIYEKKIRVASDQTIEYKFINGNAWSKDESVAGACSAGANGNRKLVIATENITFASVPCFKSCEVCINAKPDLTCDAAAIICDPFKSYANGFLPKATSPNWTVWDDDYVNAGAAYVSSNEFNSDTKSMLVDGALKPTQDAILKLGNADKGHYNLKWKMFIPTTTGGKNHAYYNIQHDITGGHTWAADVFFFSNKAGQVQAGGAVSGTFTYTPNTWMDISHDIDIDKDTAIMTIGTQKVGWRWSKGSTSTGAATTNKIMAGVDFYADSTFAKYYVDDVQLIKLPDPKAKVTFSVDMANQTVDPAKGVCVAGSFQKAAGYANDWTPGITKLVNKPNTTLWELTVELPIGKYAYKFINDDTWANGKEEKGVGCAAGGEDRQFEVTSLADVKAGTFCYGKCYNCNLRAITFFLDLTKESAVAPSQVTIAGNFQDEIGQGGDWTPGVIFLKRVAGRLYTTTLGIPAGSYEYKFLNGVAWNTEETLKGACAVGATGNRALVVGALDTKLDTVCFKHCVTCAKVIATNDPKFDASLSVYPNPTQDIVNLNYEFNATTSLKVNVMNTLGQTIYSVEMPQITAGSAVLDVHNLASGTYMMQITDENNRQTVKRFVIER